jgi:hypothetical protein
MAVVCQVMCSVELCATAVVFFELVKGRFSPSMLRHAHGGHCVWHSVVVSVDHV